MKREYRYIVVILLTGLLISAFKINTAISYIPIILIISIYLILKIYTYILSKLIKIDFTSNKIRYVRSENVDNNIKILNKSYLVSPMVSFELLLLNSKGEVIDSCFYKINLSPKYKRIIKNKRKINYVGYYFIKIENLRIYDIFILTHQKKKVNKTIKIKVNPIKYKLKKMELTNIEALLEFEKLMHMKSIGQEHTDIREYRPGDQLKDIHWNMSAHSNKLITRIREKEGKNGVSIFINLNSSLLGKDFWKYRNLYSESLYAISKYCLDKNYQVNLFHQKIYNNDLINIDDNKILNMHLDKLIDDVDANLIPYNLLIKSSLNNHYIFDNIVFITDMLNASILNYMVSLKKINKNILILLYKSSDIKLDKDLIKKIKLNDINLKIITEIEELLGGTENIGK